MLARMDDDLTDAELAIAATAYRAMAYQEGKRARKIENPTVRGPLEKNARRYAALAVSSRRHARLPRNSERPPQPRPPLPPWRE